jgi:predicted RNase H-like HicB family nuclease
MESAGGGSSKEDIPLMKFTIVFDREDDGRWIAEIESLPGVMVYGATREEAKIKVKTLARQVILEKA